QRYLPGTSRWISFVASGLRAAALGLTTFGFLILLPAAICVGHRHVGEWAVVKASLQHYNAVVAHRIGSSRRIPGRDYARLNEELFEKQPVLFNLQGFPRAVRLRLMSTESPFVGLDFGGGANAILEPTSMLCIYSD